MRRESRRAILVLLALVGLLSAACGGGDEENLFSPLLAKFKHRVHGTISKYDPAAQTFTVTDKKGRAFPFSMDGKTMMEGTIADGATATVRYRNLHGGERMATRVKIFPMATAAAPPATTATAPTTTTGEAKKP